jgi:phosphoglycolate phosphatase-like HAD superfamily hydrolase
LDILFWDIDGTLLSTGRAGLYAIEEAFEGLMGKKVEVPRISAGGRTDNYICQQLLYKATGTMPADAEVFAFCRSYEALLMKWLKATDGQVFYPIREILDYFAGNNDFKQLLLTGNSAHGARLKLEAYGLDQYFDFDHSGFACDYYFRDDLARHAREIVDREWGEAIDTIFVIGDTPYDIQCGKAIGAKTIATGTGFYPVEDLRAHAPWWLVKELPQPQEFMNKLLSVSGK